MLHISVKNKYFEKRNTALDRPFYFLSIGVLFIRIYILCTKHGSEKDDKVTFFINLKIEVFRFFLAQFKSTQRC